MSSSDKPKAIARTQATGGSLDPDFFQWQSSLDVDIELLAVDVLGSLAHIETLRRAGILDDQEAKVMHVALRELPDRVRDGKITLPDEEDVHMAVESWLHQEVGDVAKKLHTGRSRNDQVALDLKLWVRPQVQRLDAMLKLVGRTVDAFSERFGATAMPAYTHRQVAIPVLARLWIDAALRIPLERDRALLDGVRAELEDSPLGGGAIGGNTLPIDAGVAAEVLGFSRGPQNPIDAIGQRDHALLLTFVCARASMHLARFCSDVVEAVSDGLIGLGGRIACGSSMMPHKRNPDLFELVRAQSALRQGELTALMQTFHGLTTGYHRDFQQDKRLLFSCVEGTVDALRMTALGVSEITLDAEKARELLERGDAIATDLTEALVARGIPFRTAYQRIGALVSAQREQGKRLVDLKLEHLEQHGLFEGMDDSAQRELREQWPALIDVQASAERRAARFANV